MLTEVYCGGRVKSEASKKAKVKSENRWQRIRI